MSVFKCKMCGGDLNLTEGTTVAQCEYCGTTQTVPAADDEKKLTLFNRANRLRYNNEFDKAAGIYESIVADFPEEPEAYWGLVLCKYGIEYVDDPATAKKIPTCHRSSFDSIFDDANFDMVMEYSDTLAKSVYRDEAKVIENIRKGIIDVSSKEEPYDIFICYKETDENSERTLDSVLAQDVYDVLTEKGYKVFFSRITLEDKLGVEYEPYIFAALNSAKVMLAFGTSYDYYNAVWVKNEWSRYLQIIAKDHNKYLIPCFKDIDAYDMPKEFAKLQSQDMGKVGALQDLLRGIDKIFGKNETKNNVTVQQPIANTTASSVEPLLKRAFMFLEDSKWAEADEYCEKVLDINPECAEAYLGKLMAELQVKTKDNLKNVPEPFENSNNSIKASKFDSAIAEELKADNEFILERNETAQKQSVYDQALKKFANATSITDFIIVEKLFISIKDFKDADIKAKECIDKVNQIKEKAKKIALVVTPIVAAVVVFLIVLNTVILPASNYKKALANVEAGNYSGAYLLFEKCAKYKDTQEQIKLAKVKQATVLLDAKKYDEAYKILEEIRDTDKIGDSIYSLAKSLQDSKNYDGAIALYNRITEYSDSSSQLEKCYIANYGQEKWDKFKNIIGANIGDKIKFGKYEQDNNSSNGKEEIEWRILTKEGNKVLIISEKALDCKQYNTEHINVTWGTCSLRKWMNDEFYNAAFNDAEKNLIQSTKVTADKNPSYSTDPGNDTTDKVFLLSIDEANKYFSSDEDRKCVPTAYAIANGAYTIYSDTKNGICWWWLRSPGVYSNCAVYVRTDGLISDYGNLVYNSDDCVRPALWIEI